MARIVNLKHEPDAVARGAVRIDRRTAWGNPCRTGRDGTRDEMIARYRVELRRRIRSGEIALADLAAIAGRDYACWRHPLPCHGEVLARAAAWAAGRLRARAAAATPVLFRARCPQWGWLSNFAAAGFAGPGGELWPSVEHWYQAGKAEGLLLRFAPQRPDTARLIATDGRVLRHATPWRAQGNPSGASAATAAAPTASAGCWRRCAPRGRKRRAGKGAGPMERGERR